MIGVKVQAKTYKVVGEFNRAALIMGPAVSNKERHYRLLLKTRVIDHAKGRPGPERITGEYLSTIGVRGPAVGTDDPRARRLEFGYHGPDADGVTYDQPPYPHWQPAVDEVRPLFFAAMERLVAEVLP